MHSAYLLLIATAALSHAHYVGEEQEETRSPWRSFIKRYNPLDARLEEAPKVRTDSGLEERQDPLFAHLCPSPANALTQAIISQPLNMSDLGVAQNAIMDWCDAGATLNPSVGATGHVESSNGIQAQICNLQDTPMPCNSSYVQAMFAAISCGSSSSPTMGTSAPTLFTMSVSYAPAGNLSSCASHSDLATAMGLCDAGSIMNFCNN